MEARALFGEDVLELLAAVEVAVPLPLLAATAAKGTADLEDALHSLERDGLVQWVAGSRVTHTEAGRASILAGLTSVRRARLRGLVGRAALGTESFDPAMTATLVLDGSRLDPSPTTLSDLLRSTGALHRAGQLTAELAVLRLIVEAIDEGHPVDPVTRVNAICRLSFALRFAGQAEEALLLATRARHTARSSGDAAALAAAALGGRPESISMSDDPSAGGALIDEALRAGEQLDVDIRARLLAAKSEATVFSDLAGAQSAGKEALRLAREHVDPTTFTIAGYAYHVSHWHPSRQAEMLALGTEMVSVADRSAEFDEYGACTRLHVFLELGDWPHVDTELAAMERRLAAAPRPYELLWYRLIKAARLQVCGQWDAAAELFMAGFEVASGPDYGSAFNLLLGQAAINAWHQGHDLSMLTGPGLFPAGPMSTVWRAGMLGWNARSMPVEEVRAGLDDLLAEGVAGLRPDMTYGLVVGLLATAAAEIRSVPHAAMLADELAEYPDQWAGGGGALVVGPNRYHLGRLSAVLGQLEQADEQLRAARRQAAAGDCEPWVAWIDLAAAEVAAERGQPAAAAFAHAAAQRAERLGMATVAGRAGALAGSRPLPAGLTQRESAVLALAASGESNRNIAGQMHLSVKTVERHLQNAYRKIGAKNRAEAASFVTRELSGSQRLQ